MSKLKKVLTDEEIREYTEEGKGFSKAQCGYYVVMCGADGGCGNCDWLMKQCGKPNTGSGSGRPCHGCACQ